MNAVQFVSMDAARRVLGKFENAASLLRHSEVMEDGTVLVHGLSREFLFETNLVSYTVINGHHRCPDLVGL